MPRLAVFGFLLLLFLTDFPNGQIVFRTAVTFLEGFLATTTHAQYITKQLGQDYFHIRKLRDSCLLKKEDKSGVIICYRKPA